MFQIKFENSMNLMLLIDHDKSHYLYIKGFNRFTQKHFCKSCLQCFTSENVLAKHKKDCLSINGAQSIRLEKRTIEFKNYFQQIPISFKIYIDYECNLKTVL